jgi:hypothetical protein
LLADAEGYRVSVSEAGVSQVGRSYELGPVSVDDKGIFHPKVILLTGSDGPRAIIGSGNITFNGWGGNLELLDYIAPTDSEALRDLADFLEQIQRSPRVHAMWPDLSRFISACRTADQKTGDGQTRVLHSLEHSIADQIVGFAAELGGAISATVVSPYFKTIAAVKGLAEKLEIEKLSVLVPPAAPEYFPFSAADAAGLKVKAVTATICSEDRRRLHAKAIEVVCRQGRLLLSGSVNATTPALLEAKNVEVGVLRTLNRTTDLFGWRPAARPKIAGTGGPMPVASSGPVLVAHFDGASVIGRILGIASPPPAWTGVFLDDLGEKSSNQSVTVESDGTFSFEISEGEYDVWAGRSVLRLVLRNTTTEISGWVMLAPYLEAVRERGSVAEAVIRIVSGSENNSDIEVILEFFAENPQALLALASRHASKVGAGAKNDIEGNVNVSDLVPLSRASALQSHHNGGSISAFERLLERLRAYVGTHPAPENEEQEVDENGGDEGESRNREVNRSKRKSKRRIPHEDFERFLEAFVEHIEGRHENDVRRRSDLLTLLDLGLFLLHEPKIQSFCIQSS